MAHTRVLFTDSTTAECNSILKLMNFDEDHKNGFFFHVDKPVKVYLLWGKNTAFPELMGRLHFQPRVQLVFRTKEDTASLEAFSMDMAIALRNMDARSQIRLFNAETGQEVDTQSLG